MDNPQGQSTSFIPKRPSRGKVKKGGIRKIYVLSYVSYVFFFFTLITVAGIFFYKVTLERELANQKTILSQERERFSQTDIQRIKDVDGRIDAAQERLDKHLAVSTIFTALESTIVDPVQFLKFSYDRTLSNAPVIMFSGFATDYDALLFQREVLQSQPVLANATVSNVSYNTNADSTQNDEVPVTHAVAFTLEGSLDETSIQYQPYLPNENQITEPVIENEEGNTSTQQDTTADGEQLNDAEDSSEPEQDEAVEETNENTQ